MAAARIIADQLGDGMLLLMTNEQADEVSQLHVILPTFAGSTPALRRMVIERNLPRRTARSNLETQAYTMERTATQKIPVFDTTEVVRFLDNTMALKYLADTLCSFTRIESFALPIRVRKGVWRKIRFNDMDIDSLLTFCQAVDEEHRFHFYKRIADLCLFVLGMFPEHVTMDYRYPSSSGGRPKLFGRLRRSAEDYEEEGRRFYKLAGEHRDAMTLDIAQVMWQLYQKFSIAKKPLNYISEQLTPFRKARLFPSPSDN